MKNTNTAATATKKMVSLRMRITDMPCKGYKATTYATFNTYGVLLPDNRTILCEGRTFHAGRKSGFGKSAYTYERNNNRAVKVTIDRIEELTA